MVHRFLVSLECSIILDTYPELQIKLLNVYKSATFSVLYEVVVPYHHHPEEFEGHMNMETIIPLRLLYFHPCSHQEGSYST